MIKSDFGTIKVKGNKPLLMAEFVSMISGLIENKIFTKKEIKNLIRDGMKPLEETEKEFNKKYKNGINTNRMQNLIAELVKARKSGLMTDDENIDEPKIETIIDNDKFKVSQITFNGKGKSKEEIGNIIKKLFEEGEIIDDI